MSATESATETETGAEIWTPRAPWPPLAILAPPVWVAAIAGTQWGTAVLAVLAIVGLVLVLIPESRIRLYGLALVASAGILVASIAPGVQDRAGFDAAITPVSLMKVQVVLEDAPAEVSSSRAWSLEQYRASARPASGTALLGTEDVSLPGGSRIVATWSDDSRGPAPQSLGAGDTVTLSGRVEREGTTFFLAVTETLEASPVSTSVPGIGALEGMRGALHDRLRQATDFLPPDEAALVRGMTLGDTAGLQDETDEAMKTSGLTHLVAVSGANVALVYVVIAIPLLMVGVRRRTRVVLAAVAIGLYVLAVGPEPSLLRAATMAVPLLVARFIGVRTSALNALGLAVIVWSLAQPQTAAEFGFVLSVVATAAILTLSRPLATVLEEVSRGRIGPVLALAIAVPTVAQAACVPVLVLLNPETSAWAVLANMAAEVIVAPATIAGFFGVVLVLVLPPLAVPFLAVSGAGAHVLVLIAHAAEDLPGAHVPLPPGPGGALLVALAFGVAGVAIWLRGLVTIRLAVTAALVVVIGAWGAVRVGSSGDEWDVAMCAVGQGDALVINRDNSVPGSAIVVDTGPDPGLLSRCLDALGVTSIEIAILTHPHADHVGGLSALTGSRAPREAWMCPLDRETTSQLPESTRRRYPLAGYVHDARDLRIEVAWPSSAAEAATLGASEQGSDESALNDCSLTTRIATPGFALWALGDLEPLAQSALVTSPNLAPAEVVKVAHHASRRQDPELYERLQPSIAIIGVGENSFGHPHPQTLAFLTSMGVTTFRTDTQGTVRLTRVDGQWHVQTEKRGGDPAQ